MKDQEKGSELPTPYKLEQARKQGSVARSSELTGAAVVAMFFLMVLMSGDRVVQAVLDASTRLITSAGQHAFRPEVLVTWSALAVGSVASAVVPTLLAIVVIVVVITIMQVGPVFALEAIKPQWEKVNPAAGLKRLFSKKSLIDTLKASVKLTAFGLAIYFLIAGVMVKHLLFAPDSGHHMFAYMRSEISHYALMLFWLLLLFAGVDVLLVRREFLGKMMMSRKELRDEHKHREGDPRIKSRIRELRQELLKRTQALRKVPQADVLLTNPTRIAIALRYRRDEDVAPKVLAKGAGELAARMRLMARKHGIPVVEQPSIARELFRSARIDDVIPGALFPQVARIMAWAFLIRSRSGKGAAA